MSAGRPIVWTEDKKQEAFERIIDRICSGESCRSILDNANREEYPSFFTFCNWLQDNEELAKQYARACEIRADSIFDEILDISDSSNADVTISEEGKVKVDGEAIQRSRLRVDARKWVLSKLNPKKYGDKLTQEIDHTSKGEKITGIVIVDVDGTEI